jgi:hypothetical protein
VGRHRASDLPENVHKGLRHELRTGSQQRQDTLLATLVRLAQHGPHSELATVVVTACLLPGLRRQATRYGHRVERRGTLLASIRKSQFRCGLRPR